MKLIRLSLFNQIIVLYGTKVDSRKTSEMTSVSAVADLGGTQGAPPYGPKFSQFYAVFHILAPPPLDSWRPLLWAILDPPLFSERKVIE